VGATAGELGAITLLTLFFSQTKSGTASNIVTIGMFGVVVAAIGVSLGRAGRIVRLGAFLTRPQDTTAETRVRIAVALLIDFVTLAAKVGLQTIPGSFLAGRPFALYYLFEAPGRPRNRAVREEGRGLA
jgi:Kef-type K+ transport system membrane component KefB